ncbi:RecF/RecN/SMC N terminal domain-containing protein [Toxoplasma gondii ME49]|uniref:Structural maintenance of chromosomes protein n=3 Tax=Toxoplasma gondii TaxID=5811 RepID=A0A125YS49_TOXGV|nr:RecF/RecN/SMC N terminal domain-containing protein [Toxoplasma gondii ME49]EPT28957.1 RecF/RecN/SMC N terminal domain-containing protein [Toxoplasma gondii ME49]ESS35581.1 RecF/RecN/SMC N terminal domain-containing protein [Toxoplasma gondii VEG]|eukprot:XP_018636853.1 RecF/RecN/SMC N terminal domain-containing protein [Toxoplasma gondii ME49]
MGRQPDAFSSPSLDSAPQLPEEALTFPSHAAADSLFPPAGQDAREQGPEGDTDLGVSGLDRGDSAASAPGSSERPLDSQGNGAPPQAQNANDASLSSSALSSSAMSSSALSSSVLSASSLALALVEKGEEGSRGPQPSDAVPSSLALPRKRLMIERVVLENFKSYGKKKTIGPFHKRFTAIVGPNGSGKSNVIDAMLFVFGRRAQQIRLKNVVELIHNSAAGGGEPLQSARVTVFFQEIYDPDPDSETYEVIPGSQFVVSREVSRASNSTEYRVNGQRAQQRQVVELLKSKGLDLQNNRFLILQGEVEQIALMKPKATRPEETGLLEYLEELVGSNRLVEPIQKAQEDYEASCQQYQEKANRCRAAGAEVKQLEGPKNEAVKFLHFEKDVQTNALLLAALDGRELSAVYRRKRRELAKLEKQKEEDEEKGAVLAKQFEALGKELDDLWKKDKKLQTQFAEVDGRFNQMVWRDEELRNELFSEAQASEEKTQKVKANEKKREEEQKMVDRSQTEVDEKKSQIPAAEEAYEKAKEDVEAYRESIQDEVRKLAAAHSKAEQHLAPLQTTLDEQMKGIAKLSKEFSLLEKKKLRGEQEYKNLEESLGKLKQLLQDRRAGTEQKTQLLATIRAEKGEAARRREEAQGEVSRLRERLREIQSKAHAIEARRVESKSNSRLMQALQKMKKTGEIKGLHDRLGELGCIDRKYEKAFMAAGGGFCSFLVVEEPQDATVIFQILRQQNLGRVNILALRVLERDLTGFMQRSDAEARAGGFPLPRLIDLISFKKERYRVAFYKAVGDTVVAPDMDEASKIAYSQRRRVVTLDGGLIEVDGRMVGGGVRERSGAGQGIRVSEGPSVETITEEEEDNLPELREEIREKEQRLRSLLRESEESEESLARLNTQEEETESSLVLLRQDIQAAERQVHEVTERLASQSKESLSSEEKKKMGMLQKEIDRASEKQKATLEEVKEQEHVVSTLYRHLQDAGGEEMKKRKSKLLVAERDLNRLKGQVTFQLKEVTDRKVECENLKRANARLTKEVADHQKRLTEISEQLAQMEEDAKEVLAEKEKIEEERSKLEEEMKSLRSRKEAVEEDIKQLGLNTLDVQHQLTTLQAAVEQAGQARQAQLQQASAAVEKLSDLQKTLTDEGEEEESPDAEGSGPTEHEEEEEKKGEEPVGGDLEGDMETCEKASREEAPEDSEAGAEAGGEGGAESSSRDGSSDADEETEHDFSALLLNRFGELLRRLKLDARLAASHLKSLDKKALLAERQKLAAEQRKGRAASGEGGSLHALVLYRQKKKEFEKKEEDMQLAWKNREAAKRLVDQLCAERKKEFMDAFVIIAAKLKETYRMLSQGGDAELELVDSSDPFSEGVLLSVRPPKKSWRLIQHLSGGEKTLSSLSLVFALHHFSPTCVYFLDEIDAALDYRNVSILANFVKQKAKDAQFIIISLRNQLFELANRLVGIYKTFDVTKSVAVDPDRFSTEEKGDENLRPLAAGSLEGLSGPSAASPLLGKERGIENSREEASTPLFSR